MIVAMRAKRTILYLFAVMSCGVAIIAQAGPGDETIFYDSFQGQLGSGWSWIREDRANWRVGDRGLEVRIQPGNMWGPANDARNLLVRDAPSPEHQKIQIVASVENHPTHQYEQVDLVWYYTDSDMVKIGEELVDGKLSIVMGRERNDRTRTIKIIPLDSAQVQLCLVVSGSRAHGRFKTPTGDWRDVGECDLPVKGKPKISLQFYQGLADVEHWARVSDFTITRLQ
jgi:hypothetical protein